MSAHGYIDDAAFALAKSRTLSDRGYGKKRLLETLRAAGVDEADSIGACNHADVGAVEAALRFAKKRRLGPFADFDSHEPRRRERALRAMVHAGHGFELARAILRLRPGEEIDMDELNERARVTIA
jgi:regulatory protein